MIQTAGVWSQTTAMIMMRHDLHWEIWRWRNGVEMVSNNIGLGSIVPCGLELEGKGQESEFLYRNA